MTPDTLTFDVTACTGLPETMLPESLLSRLPATAPPAPWATKCDAVTWIHEPDPAAVDSLPDAIRGDGIALVIWALVRYADTPVGPYSEIAATLVPDGGDGRGYIPFIVVDSLASIVGGRANWLLPKALASFDWSADFREVVATGVEPSTPAWSISVSHQPHGEASPLSMDNHGRQVSRDGEIRHFDGLMNGSMSSTTVTVDGHADGPLAALLVPGSYEGTILADCHFDVGTLS